MNDVFLMRYAHVPYGAIRADRPLTELDRALFTAATEIHLEREYASNPSRNES